MLIDTHCHVHFKAFEADADEVIVRTKEKQVIMNAVGTQRDTSRRAVEFVERYDGIYASVGLHPVHLFSQHIDEEESSFNTREENFDYDFYHSLAVHPKTIAIGECGLDLYRLPENIDRDTVLAKQTSVFRDHWRLAQAVDLPLAIHVRDAYPEMIDLLKDLLVEYQQTTVRAVVHCYIGNWTYAQEFLKLGMYLGFTGIITFPPKKSAPEAQAALIEVVRNCPLDRMVLETDSPYLAPGKYRGKRSEPWMVEEVARKIAELKGISYQEVVTATTANARRLFTKIA